MGKHEDKTEKFKRSTYKVMIRTLVAFAIPAIIGAVAGTTLDRVLGTTPLFTLGLLGILYVVSWAVVARMITSARNEYKQDKTEEIE